MIRIQASQVPHCGVSSKVKLPHATLVPYVVHIWSGDPPNLEGTKLSYLTPYTLHPTPYTLHPTPYTLHPTPYTLHPTPHTLHPAPYTLHPAPYTLRPTPYTLHPTPYTLHPTPYTLHPDPLPEGAAAQRNVRACLSQRLRINLYHIWP